MPLATPHEIRSARESNCRPLAPVVMFLLSSGRSFEHFQNFSTAVLFSGLRVLSPITNSCGLCPCLCSLASNRRDSQFGDHQEMAINLSCKYEYITAHKHTSFGLFSQGYRLDKNSYFDNFCEIVVTSTVLMF